MSVRATSLCLVSFARLGDTVCKLPALWALREAYPDAHIRLVTQAETRGSYVTSRAVLEGTGLVDSFDQLLIQGTRAQRWLDRLKLIARMRARTWDAGVVLVPNYPPATPAIFDTLARYLRYFGCRSIVRPRRNPKHFEKSGGRLAPLPHVADDLLDLVSQLGIPVPPPQSGKFSMPRREEDARWAEAALARSLPHPPKGLVAVSTGANMQSNIWPVGRYAAVLKQLWQRHEIAPVFFGPEGFFGAIEAEMRELPARASCQGESIGRVAELMRKCSFYLGNDTGLMHLAVSVGLKCVMVSGARNAPGMWSPYGAGHEVLRSPIDCEGCLMEVCSARGNQCLMDISAGRVYAAAEKVFRAL